MTTKKKESFKAFIIQQDWELPPGKYHQVHKALIEHIFKWRGWMENKDSVIHAHKDKKAYKYFADMAEKVSKTETLPVLLEELVFPVIRSHSLDKRVYFETTTIEAKMIPMLRVLLSVLLTEAGGSIIVFDSSIWRLERWEFSCMSGLAVHRAEVITDKTQRDILNTFTQEARTKINKILGEMSIENVPRPNPILMLR